MPYFAATVYIHVSEENADWDCGCDETFHLGRLLHDPDEGLYLSEYHPVSWEEFEENKHKIFTERGGI